MDITMIGYKTPNGYLCRGGSGKKHAYRFFIFDHEGRFIRPATHGEWSWYKHNVGGELTAIDFGFPIPIRKRMLDIPTKRPIPCNPKKKSPPKASIITFSHSTGTKTFVCYRQNVTEGVISFAEVSDTQVRTLLKAATWKSGYYNLVDMGYKILIPPAGKKAPIFGIQGFGEVVKEEGEVQP